MGSGPLIAIVGIALSLGLTKLVGYAPWLLVLLGVLWLAALTFVWFFGHRSFGTRANTDFTIAFAGLAVTLAVMVPKYVESQPCGQARLMLTRAAKAEEKWRDAHGLFTSEVSALELDSFPDVKLSVTTDGGVYEVVATHPACVGEDGGVRTLIGP